MEIVNKERGGLKMAMEMTAEIPWAHNEGDLENLTPVWHIEGKREEGSKPHT